MRFTFPLSAQIATILVLNIAAILLLRTFLETGGSGKGFESILYSPVSERLQLLSFQLHHQMRDMPKEGLSDLLNQYGQYYNVNLNMYDLETGQFQVPIRPLPPDVRAKMTEISRPPPMPPPALHSIPPEADRHPPRPPSFVIHTSSPSRYWVGVIVPPDTPGDKPAILLADSENLWKTKLTTDFQYVFQLVFALFALSFLVWLPFIFYLTASLRKLTLTTEKISEGQFDINPDIKRPDEIGSLSRSIQKMSSKLNNFVLGQKRFLGDIAHELCSPIARQQMAIELLEDKCPEENKRLLTDIKEESVQMSALVNELLAFSKAGLNGTKIDLKNVALVTLIEDTIKKTAPNPDAEVQIIFDHPPGRKIECLADELLVSRMLGNILRNAIKYAGDAGPIEISLQERDEIVTIEVRDHGPGVPEEAIQRLGEPFYRPDQARSRESGGVGLGLAIVKSCVETCKGRFSCRNRENGGLEITIELKKDSAKT